MALWKSACDSNLLSCQHPWTEFTQSTSYLIHSVVKHFLHQFSHFSSNTQKNLQLQPLQYETAAFFSLLISDKVWLVHRSPRTSDKTTHFIRNVSSDQTVKKMLLGSFQTIFVTTHMWHGTSSPTAITALHLKPPPPHPLAITTPEPELCRHVRYTSSLPAADRRQGTSVDVQGTLSTNRHAL